MEDRAVLEGQTSLTFYGHRVLLASSNQRSKYRLALQFLDYPLLLLRACQSDGNTDVLPISTGKSCVLSLEDSLEAVHLIQQVPCSLLLLKIQHSTPQLVAAGAVEVQLQHTARAGHNSSSGTSARQVVILRDQQQQPVACAEVHVYLQTPHAYHSSNSQAAAVPGSYHRCMQDSSATPAWAWQVQDSTQQPPVAQLQQPAWPAQHAAQQQLSPAGQLGVCWHVQHSAGSCCQHTLQPPAAQPRDMQGAQLPPQGQDEDLSQQQQQQQQQLNVRSVHYMGASKPAAFPAVLQHKQLAPGQPSPVSQRADAAQQHWYPQQSDTCELANMDNCRPIQADSTGCAQLLQQQQHQKHQQQQQQVSRQQDVSRSANRSPSPHKKQAATPAGRPSSSRHGSPNKLASAKAAAAARTQQMQEHLRQIKARMAAQHKQQRSNREAPPTRAGYRAQPPLLPQQRQGERAAVSADDIDCDLVEQECQQGIQHSRAPGTSTAAAAAAAAACKALQLLSGGDRHHGGHLDVPPGQQQKPQEQPYTQPQQQQQGLGHGGAGVMAVNSSSHTGCLHCDRSDLQGVVQPQQQQQQQQQQQLLGLPACSGISCCSHTCTQQQQQLRPTAHQHACHHPLNHCQVQPPPQQQQQQQQRWQGGVSAATSVVWELLTLMSVRAVMSQAVTGLTDQLSGAMRGMMQQACLQQGLGMGMGLGLSPPWQTLSGLSAPGAAHAAGTPSVVQPPSSNAQASTAAAASGGVGGVPGAGWMHQPYWYPAGAMQPGSPWSWGAGPVAVPHAAAAGAAAGVGPVQNVAACTHDQQQQQQQQQQEGAKLTPEQLQAQQEELAQQFQELEGLLVIRAEHSSSSSSSGGGSRRTSAVDSLATGMAVTLRRSVHRRSASISDSAQCAVDHSAGGANSSSSSGAAAAGGGFRALPDALQPRNSADGAAAVAAVEETVQTAGRVQPASAFASAAAADSSRPQSPNGPAGLTGSLSGSLPGSAANILLTKRPSNRLPTHLPPLPRAASGSSAAGAAAAAAAVGSGAGGSAPGGAWHMLGSSKSSSGMVPPVPRGAAGTASGVAGEALSGCALDSLLPQSLRRSSLRPLLQASSLISDSGYEDDFEPASSTAPGSPSIPSPKSPSTAAAGLPGGGFGRQAGSSSVPGSFSGCMTLPQQHPAAAAAAGGKHSKGLSVAAQGPRVPAAAPAPVQGSRGSSRHLPEIEEAQEYDGECERSSAIGVDVRPGSGRGVGAPSWPQALRGEMHHQQGGQSLRNSSSSGGVAAGWHGGAQGVGELSLPVVIQRGSDTDAGSVAELSYADSFASAADEVVSEKSISSSISSNAAAAAAAAVGRRSMGGYVPSVVKEQQRSGGGTAVMSAVLSSNVRQRTPPLPPAAAATAAAGILRPAAAPARGHSAGNGVGGAMVSVRSEQSLSDQGSYDDAASSRADEESSVTGSSYSQPQQQQQPGISTSVSLDSDLSELLAELSSNRASRMGSRQEAHAPGSNAASASPTTAVAAGGAASSAARAAAAAAVGLLSGGRAPASGGGTGGSGRVSAASTQAQQPRSQHGTSAGAPARRLSSYSDVSLFSDDDEVLAGHAEGHGNVAAAVAAAAAGQARARDAAAGSGVAKQLGSARISGDSRYSSFSMDGSDIEIDYDELASLGIDLNAPSAAGATARTQAVAGGGGGRHLQQQRPVTAHGLTAAAGQQGGVQRPGTSYGLPPKPQQQQQQQQYGQYQQQYGVRQPGGVKAVSAGSPVGASGGAAVTAAQPGKGSAASVFYEHVSGAPMSSNVVGRPASRGY